MSMIANAFAQDLLGVLFWIFIFINAVLVPFCIFLAFKFATASNEERRRSAKTRFINVLVSIVIIAILIGILVSQGALNGDKPPGEPPPPSLP